MSHQPERDQQQMSDKIMSLYIVNNFMIKAAIQQQSKSYIPYLGSYHFLSLSLSLSHTCARALVPAHMHTPAYIYTHAHTATQHSDIAVILNT
jgi:hypothetical protein